MEYTEDNLLGLEIKKDHKRRINQKFIQKAALCETSAKVY